MMPAIIVAGHLAVAVADRPPVLNVEQTCRDETASALQNNDKIEICIADEKHARDMLAAQWSSFNATARASCTRTSTSGHVSSYLELLVCLELDQADREVRGQGGAAGLTITSPARSVDARDEPIDSAPSSSPSRPAPVAAPSRPAPAPPAPRSQQQQQPAARSAATTPPAPQPAAPLQVTPSPPAEDTQPPTQGEVLQQSFCRSPLGYVLPGCR